MFRRSCLLCAGLSLIGWLAVTGLPGGVDSLVHAEDYGPAPLPSAHIDGVPGLELISAGPSQQTHQSGQTRYSPAVSVSYGEAAAPAPAPAFGSGSAAAKKKLAAAVAGSHKGLYFDNAFDYLLDPYYDDNHLGDSFKRLCVSDCGILDVGGEYRLRYHSEKNIRNLPGLGLTGADDDFLLHRFRLYANLEFGTRLRLYAEMIDAQSNYENLAPRPIEENRTDLLNAFADYRIYENGCGQLWARLGRQELLYGKQRSISPLDWANTRRTFEGAKLYWEGTNWDIDAFWMQPVAPVAHRFDSPNTNSDFAGIWATYKAAKNYKADFYYLLLNASDAPTNFAFNTVGARFEGQRGPWLGELWGAYQFGTFGSADHSAGAFTTGLGRTFPCAPWNPVLWAYYDWASGDDIQGNGYHHLFPLSHKYLGFMDLFGRRNIEDLNFLLTLSPTAKVKLLCWWHLFYLENPNDVPYNVVMGPEVATPGGSGELGQELDLVANWNISPRLNLLFGYSHFFSGDFYSTNPSPPRFDGDADFYYTQLSLRF